MSFQCQSCKSLKEIMIRCPFKAKGPEYKYCGKHKNCKFNFVLTHNKDNKLINMFHVNLRNNELKYEDIEYFFTISKKHNNDMANNIREKILQKILILSVDYFNHEIYGDKWNFLKNNFKNIIENISFDIKYDNLIINRKGGRKYNYDFELLFYYNSDIVKNIHLEFKFHNTSIKKIPQFLELYDKDCKNKYDMIDETYAYFFYNKYLCQYLKTDEELKLLTIPLFKDYEKYVYDIKYKHEFFKNLYLRKNFYKKEKAAIVKLSIKDFLSQKSRMFNFSKIEEYINLSQRNKIILFWNLQNFSIEYFREIKITNFTINDNLITINLNDNTILLIRLNWGNNNGIANPRWKFSLKNK